MRGAARSIDGADLFARAEALFGEMPDGVLIQQAGRIVYANRRSAGILGCHEPAQLLGMVALEFYAEADLPSVLARLQSAYFGRPTTASHHVLRRSDGKTAEVEVSCLLLRIADVPMLIEVLRTQEIADGRCRGDSNR